MNNYVMIGRPEWENCLDKDWVRILSWNFQLVEDCLVLLKQKIDTGHTFHLIKSILSTIKKRRNGFLKKLREQKMLFIQTQILASHLLCVSEILPLLICIHTKKTTPARFSFSSLLYHSPSSKTSDINLERFVISITNRRDRRIMSKTVIAGKAVGTSQNLNMKFFSILNQ